LIGQKDAMNAKAEDNDEDGGAGDDDALYDENDNLIAQPDPAAEEKAAAAGGVPDRGGAGGSDDAPPTPQRTAAAAAAGDEASTAAAAADSAHLAQLLAAGGPFKKLDKLSDWAAPGTRVRHGKSGCVGVVVGVNVAWTAVRFDSDPGKAMSGSGLQRSCRVRLHFEIPQRLK
jgi:hypothetical protein